MEVKASGSVIKAVEHVNAASTSQTVPIFSIPPNAFVLALGGRVKTAFSGVTFPMVEVGISGDTTKFIKKQPIDHADDLKRGSALYGGGYCSPLDPEGTVQSSAIREVIATFRSGVGNLSSLTAGEIEFFMVYVD